MRLLATDPQHRFQTARELGKTLDQLLARVPAPVRPPPAFSPSPNPGGGAGPSSGAAASAGASPALAMVGVGASQVDPIGRTQTNPGGFAALSGRRLRDDWRRLGVAIQHALPGAVRTALGRVPTPLLPAVLGLVAIIVMIGLAAAVKAMFVASSDSSESEQVTAQAAPVTASIPSSQPGPRKVQRKLEPSLLAEVESAKKGGVQALRALATQHVNNTDVLIALAQAELAEKDPAGATRTVKKLLVIDPKLQDNGRVSALLFQTAQPRSSSDEAFALLTGPMGARGGEILYDLSIEPKVRTSVRKRALSWLRSDAVDKLNAPGLRAALELRFAKTCSEKRKTLQNVAEHGDRRSLALLKKLREKTGCGPNRLGDCYACLRGGDELERAVSKVEARVRK